MDSYNPFAAPEDPFDEEVQQPLAESQDSKIYNLLKPVALVAFSIVFVIATISLFTRPATEIIVIQETPDKPLLETDGKCRLLRCKKHERRCMLQIMKTPQLCNRYHGT